MTRPPLDPDPARLFAGLIRLVTERAESVRTARPGDPRPMDGLREAVEALDHYLEAVELVRRSGGEIGLVATGADPAPDVSGPSEAPTAPPRVRPAPRNPIPRGWAEPGVLAPPRSHHDEQSVTPAPASDDPPAAATDGGELGDEEFRSGLSGELAHPAVPGFAAFRDQLTGLHTRDGFDAVAGGELKRCARHERVFVLVMVRLPDPARSELKRAASVIKSDLRASDLTCRESEQTLILALPETTIGDGRAVARRLVRALATEGIWGSEGRVGLASYPAEGETLEKLFEAAREQLQLVPERILTDLPGRNYSA